MFCSMTISFELIVMTSFMARRSWIWRKMNDNILFAIKAFIYLFSNEWLNFQKTDDSRRWINSSMKLKLMWSRFLIIISKFFKINVFFTFFITVSSFSSKSATVFWIWIIHSFMKICIKISYKFVDLLIMKVAFNKY